MVNIYFEKQNGNLCRLHSINHYYGEQKLTIKDFYRKCKEYDSYYQTKSAKNHDYFNEGQSLISFILNKCSNDFVLLIQNIDFDRFQEERKYFYKEYLQELQAVFLFNGGHIWLRKKINDKWYNIDSLSGVREVDSPFIKGLGHMVVIPRKLYVNELVVQIKQLKCSNLMKGDMQKYYAKYMLGDGEIPICNIFYLGINIERNKLFEEIENIVLKFRKNKRYLIIKKHLIEVKSILENMRKN